jgi:hypothetical protein
VCRKEEGPSSYPIVSFPLWFLNNCFFLFHFLCDIPQLSSHFALLVLCVFLYLVTCMGSTSMAGRGMAPQPHAPIDYCPVVQCAELQIQWTWDNRPLITFVYRALVVESRLPAMWARAACIAAFSRKACCHVGHSSVQQLFLTNGRVHVALCYPVSRSPSIIIWAFLIHYICIVLRNRAKTLHLWNVGFAEIVKKFVSHLGSGVLFFARRKHSWKNTDKSHTSC